ncbi:cyclopropane fatty acyl phospholipid synthase [Lentisalinibacter orientalis]|uniref:cyclopropane fatty acyl phospholipid synthase n=1 Tax=Lentisalinibacter orientalis TaxID=2992241 RepID=UPI00386A5680
MATTRHHHWRSRADERYTPQAADESSGERALQRLIEPAGLTVNGNEPWDPVIRDQRACAEILRRGSLGAGEAYMRGWWDSRDLSDLFYRLLRAGLPTGFGRWQVLKLALREWLTNPQRAGKAFQIGEAHYDRGNDLFRAMLDKRLVYSCGYWAGVDDLDAAQGQKLDLICRKLGLRAGQRVLDIGCGWGSFCRFAAERYGVSTVGVTVSREQVELGRELCDGLPVELRLQDYRELDGSFDHIVSVGMAEHVGVKNYGTLLDVARRCLKPGGLFLLHTIGRPRTTRSADPWINRYIFPNGHLPSLRQLTAACEGRFVVEDVHNFGADYDRTLMAWFANFDAAWPALRERYDETFYRMWKYYLLSCAGAFRARDIQLWQLVLSPRGLEGGYRRPQ